MQISMNQNQLQLKSDISQNMIFNKTNISEFIKTKQGTASSKNKTA